MKRSVFGKRGLETLAAPNVVMPTKTDQVAASSGTFAARFARIAGQRPVDIARENDKKWRQEGGS